MAFKVTAFILCTLMLITTVLSVFAFIFMMVSNFYTKPLDEIRKDSLYSTLYLYAEETSQTYHYYSKAVLENNLKARNAYFDIKDNVGNILYSNYSGEDVVFSETFNTRVEEYIYIGGPDTDVYHDTSDEAVTTELDTGIPEETFLSEEISSPYHTEYLNEHQKLIVYEYEVTVHLPKEYHTLDKVSFIDGIVKALYSMRVAVYIIGVSAALLFIILLVVLCCISGWKKGEDKPRTCLFDKIPFDIFTAIYTAIFTLSISLFIDFYFEDFEVFLFIAAAIIFGSVLLLSYIYSFAARAKTGELFKNTVIWWILKNILTFIRFICRGAAKVICNIPLFGKTFLLLAALALWSFVLAVAEPGFSIFLWLLAGTIITLFALYITYGLNKLKKGGESIAQGKYSHKIDTGHLLPSLKKHAESLNSISDGMSKALEERLKSERFRTELITNVSHDLKTPLTSIVNYIDLLKTERAQETPDEEKIEEYIEVIDRQSQRLRKLTVDLVEASKASTGNLEVIPAPVELGEMISQTQGEYAEKLSALGLELIVRLPSEPLTIMADGKHLWRIFDNLMNNIAKYALSGTRVYIDVFEKVGKAYIIFRNTSRYELNISADELTERFVRGDSSRHTEGSGLGLSIARSLAELNGGELEIYIDGDLFKVVLGFEALKKPQREKDKNSDEFT